MEPGRKKIIVYGSSALTNGIVGLYHEMNRFGCETLFLYHSSDRMHCPEFEVKSERLRGGFLLSMLQLAYRTGKFRPDLVEFYLHEFSRFGGFKELAALLIMLFLRVRVTVVCTGREILGWKDHRWPKKWAVKLALKMSRVFLIKEDYMQRHLVDFRIADPAKARFIHNGVHESLARGVLRTFSAYRNILFLNSFKTWRNVDFLAECACKAISLRSDLVFFLVGARNHRENAVVSAIRDRLPEEQRWRLQVHYMNDNAPFYYGLAEIFVLPADIVWLNNSLLEAMHLGLIVMAPNVPWVEKIIVDGCNGFIFRHKDQADLLAKLDLVLNLPHEQVEAIRAQAQETIARRFSTRKRALLHWAFYQSCLFDRELSPEVRELLKPTQDYQVRSMEEVTDALRRSGIPLDELVKSEPAVALAR